MTAGWFIAWQARCRARSRSPPKPRRGQGPAMSGSARRARSTGCLQPSSRPTRRVINDPRVGCILVGPGLGDIPQVLTLALTAPRPIVIDADGIGLVGEPERLKGHDVILTPHEGEFVQAVRQHRRQQGRARAGGRRAQPVGDRLQGPRYAGGRARRAPRLRTARAGLARQRGNRRRSRRDHRSDEGAGAELDSKLPAPASGCTAAPRRSQGQI